MDTSLADLRLQISNIHAFRSEEHVDQWCERTWMARGATMTVEQCWRLSQWWYPERLAPNWHRRDAAEKQALFAEVGLTEPFWLLPSQ